MATEIQNTVEYPTIDQKFKTWLDELTDVYHQFEDDVLLKSEEFTKNKYKEIYESVRLGKQSYSIRHIFGLDIVQDICLSLFIEQLKSQGLTVETFDPKLSGSTVKFTVSGWVKKSDCKLTIGVKND